MSLFFKPTDGWAADFIPFYWDGVYHLFYLKDYRDHAGHGEGTPWFHVSTRDFVQFADHGEALPRGTVNDQDLYVFTGCVMEHAGTFHIFYTGHNPHFRAQGKPEQAVMHATSDDLITWRKQPDDTFFAPSDAYEPHDWRDPFVFWNEQAGEFWMLLAARTTSGPSRRRGCTALCASRDLREWEVREPFWSPALYFTHECPDLFRMGAWWYLVFSEFSEASVTRYRMSRTLDGPWLAPANDTFDGRAFYAAKTASDGDRRYVFGWNPTREGERDDGRWQWGGNLVTHEIVQRDDGTLDVRLPATVREQWSAPQPVAWSGGIGDWTAQADGVALAAPDGWACAEAGPLPAQFRVEATISFDAATRACGIMLRTSDDLEQGYYVRLEPARQRLVLDRWPRPGDLPFAVELERPLVLDPARPVRLTVLLDGTICEVYADDVVAMSARLYDLAVGGWGVFVGDGTAQFVVEAYATTTDD